MSASRTFGKKGCGVAAVDLPGAGNQPVHLHEVIVEALQPLLGLASSGTQAAAHSHISCPQMNGQQTDAACHIRE